MVIVILPRLFECLIRHPSGILRQSDSHEVTHQIFCALSMTVNVNPNWISISRYLLVIISNNTIRLAFSIEIIGGISFRIIGDSSQQSYKNSSTINPRHTLKIFPMFFIAIFWTFAARIIWFFIYCRKCRHNIWFANGLYGQIEVSWINFEKES